MNLGIITRSLAAVALSMAVSVTALAADVKLSNGSVWKGDVGAKVRATFVQGGKEFTIEGTVVKAEERLVVIETMENGRTVKKTIVSFDLRKLETVAAAQKPAGPAPAAAADGTAVRTVTDQVDAQTAEMPHIFVLPLSGMVGTYMRHDEIEKVAAEADKYGPGQIIVLLIDSGGGMVIEGDKIHETMKEVKKRHRVVAWIKRAISAAAFTALHCDEIYFMRVGALGSITMFSGTTSISGRELDAWLEKVGEACKIGGREPIVGQAMVTNPILCSYDRDEDGNVTWYSTLQGEFDLSDEKENLTLNADNALHSKFSDGTADTVEELARCMQLKEWKEEEGTGRKIYENWQRTMKQCVEQKQRLYNDLQNPAGVDGEAMIGNRIKTLTEILKWYDRCYPGMVYEQPNFPPDPEELKRELANLKKQLGDMKKRNR